jgi:MFS transporter, DHA1 family, multidrug resistance protein
MVVSGAPAASDDTGSSANDRYLRSLRLSVFLTCLPFGMLVFGVPLIARAMGAGSLGIGGLFSTYAAVVVISQPLIGRGLDRLGRRPFLIAGLLAYALSNMVFALTSGIGGLYLAQVAQGVGSGLTWLAALSIVSDLAPADGRGREYGRIEEVAFRGTLLGSLVGFALLRLLEGDRAGGWLTLAGGWRLLFLAYTVITLVAAAIVWRKIPETLSQYESPVDKTAARGAWRLPGQLWILMGIVALTAIAFGLLEPILMPFLFDNVSTSMLALGLAFLPAAVAGSVLPSRLGGASDRLGRRPLMAVALAVAGLTAAAVPFVRSLWPLAVLWVFEAAAFAAATPAEEALVIDLADKANQGSALGYYTVAAAFGGVIGPLLGGWIYARSSAGGVFITTASLLVLGAILVLLLLREPSRAKLAPPRVHL